MRVTVTIDDDVLAAAKALAARKGCSLGSVLSELARRGFDLGAVRKGAEESVFAVPSDTEAVTNEDVHRSLDDWP